MYLIDRTFISVIGVFDAIWLNNVFSLTWFRALAITHPPTPSPYFFSCHSSNKCSSVIAPVLF